MLARELLLEPLSMILNIDVSKQWGWVSALKDF